MITTPTFHLGSPTQIGPLTLFPVWTDAPEPKRPIRTSVPRGATIGEVPGGAVVELVEELIADDLAWMQGRLTQNLVAVAADIDGNAITISPYGVNSTGPCSTAWWSMPRAPSPSTSAASNRAGGRAEVDSASTSVERPWPFGER